MSKRTVLLLILTHLTTFVVTAGVTATLSAAGFKVLMGDEEFEKIKDKIADAGIPVK